MTVTPAQRRWGLLRNVRLATEKNSLTKDEEEFLDNVLQSSSSSSAPSPATSNCSIRNGLRTTVASLGENLTPYETKFLVKLSENPDLSDDILKKANETLKRSSIYNCDDKNSKEKSSSDFNLGLSKGAATREEDKPFNEKDHFQSDLWKTKLRSSQRITMDKEEDAETVIETKSEGKNNAAQNRAWDILRRLQLYFQHRICFNYIFSIESQIEEPKDGVDVNLMENDHDRTDNDENSSSTVIPFTILGADGETYSSTWPHVLSPPLMDTLRQHMPYVVQEDNYWLKYSLMRDGCELFTLLSRARNSPRTILAIETLDGEVFGAFTSTPWHHSGHTFYGSGESFVWRMGKSRRSGEAKNVEEQAVLESDVRVFKWSGKNRNVQMSSSEKLIVGGGGEENNNNSKEWTFGLALQNDLSRGQTGDCITFDSSCLAPSTENNEGIFEVRNVEVWTMTPVVDVHTAEKLELGRQFIFEHGAFQDF